MHAVDEQSLLQVLEAKAAAAVAAAVESLQVNAGQADRAGLSLRSM
jgi:hypothetical protein